jgi:AmiR/NasT family two-component response regulator
MRPEVLSMDLPWLRRDGSPPAIPVVNYENPVIVEAVLQLNAYGVIASPVKSFGLLTSIVVAVNQAEKARTREKYIARLEQRIAGLRKINKAKAILMNTRGLSEDDAYKIIRDQAMSKRVTAEEIADAVINANEILGFDLKS